MKTGVASRLLVTRKVVCALIYATILFFLIIESRVDGQSVQADQAQLLQNQLQPPFAPGPPPSTLGQNQVVTSPNDTDLGEQQLLKRITPYQAWTFSIASPIFYTSNVALMNTGVIGDAVEAPIAGIYYQPRIAPTLYGNLDIQQQNFFYDKYKSFNFGSMDAELGLNYFLPKLNNLVLRGKYDFNRLTHSDFSEFFSNHAVLLNAEMPFRLGHAQHISFGAGANISVAADHQFSRRNDYEGYVGYTVSLSRSFAVSVLGRSIYRVYHENGRADLSEIVSVNANYQINDWLTVSAINSFSHNDSNRDLFDYNVVDLGGSLSLTVKF